MLSPDYEGRVKEHGVLLPCAICSCILQSWIPSASRRGSCGVGMQRKATGCQYQSSGMLCCVTSLACWPHFCWRGSPMFGIAGKSCLWNRVRMQKIELHLGQTVGSWPAWVMPPARTTLNPSGDGVLLYNSSCNLLVFPVTLRTVSALPPEGQPLVQLIPSPKLALCPFYCLSTLQNLSALVLWKQIKVNSHSSSPKI